MKILNVILLSGVVLALAGCGNQGGSTDPYDTESGATSNTNYNPRSATNDYQGSARSPDRINTGVDYGTNYPANDQGGATNSYKNGGQSIDPQRTNNVPEN